MQVHIDPTLVARLEAIKVAYESGVIAAVPYIEPRSDYDFSDFTQILEVKKDDSSGGQGGGGGGTARGLRQNTRPLTRRR